MKRIGLYVVVLIITLTPGTILSKEYFVSEEGVDESSRSGSLEQPWRELSWVLSGGILQPGDTLTALPGFYQRLSFWDERYFFDPENPILIRSKELHAAGTNGINFGKGTGMIFEGFEAGPGREGQNVVQLAWPETHDIVLRNCLIHDAAPGGDCLKINASAHHILVEGCVIYNPGDRSTGGYPTETWQENIDLYDSDYITVRNCWIYHIGDRGDHIAYTKGTATNIVFENNVIGPQATAAHEGALSAGSRSTAHQDGFVAFDITFRGNVLIDCGYSAVGVFAVKNTTIADNIIYNCGYRPSPIDPEQPAPITFRISEGATPEPQYRSENTTIEGNIIIGLGNMGPVAVAPQENTVVDGLVNRNNRYWNGGNPISSEGLFDPNTEEGATFDDPGFVVPDSLDLENLDYATIRGWFRTDEPPASLDFNGDGVLNIVDAIALLLFQRDNPGDLRADYNRDWKSDISDAIALLLDIMRR